MPPKKILDEITDVAEKAVEGIGKIIVNAVTSGDHVALPVKDAVKVISIGVTAVRKKKRIGRAIRKMAAAEAGRLTDLFGRAGKTGGEAFERWVAGLGLDVKIKQPQSYWDDLLAQFTKRPLHGHRRGKAGGTHRRSK